MNRTFEFVIDQDSTAYTISDFLKLQGFSHRNLVTLKKIPQSILLNGTWAYTSALLKEGDCLSVHYEESDLDTSIVPVNLPFQIIYEDADILVVNKAENMPIHPSINNYYNTLANAVHYYYLSQNTPFVFRCINRLDRDTSGLTIIAKHSISAAQLSNMMIQRQIKRTYLAICCGENLPESNTITAPIGRLEGSTIQRQVDFENGDYAVTHYKKLDSKNGLSLVSLQLETGRTHQIRVHMQHIGHPIIGDFLYHPENNQMSRQALHAYQLEFPHPVTKKQLTFQAPLPTDMSVFFQEPGTL